MRKFNSHSDAGHGWLAVKLDMLEKLDLIDKISKFSYIKGKTVYLEEDCDASLFVQAFTARFGEIVTVNKWCERSPIRGYASYSPDMARIIMQRND
jgi:hypothetical protein